MGDCREVVAIERDVEAALGRRVPFELLDLLRQSLGDRHTARRIPISTRSSTPLLRSTISCAIRVMMRRIPSASMISAFSLSVMLASMARVPGGKGRSCTRR
jgi:hypothetical protein